MNNRSAQALAATLAFVLIVLVGATIFILLSRPAVPGPTASPSGGPTFTPTAGPSSSATPLPTSSASPSPTSTPIVLPTDTPSPTPEPTITPTPSPSPSPSPSPTPSPTLPPPTSEERQVTVLGFGLDSRSGPTPVARTVTFRVDGPSLISARLSNVNTGKVRMCLQRDDVSTQRECITTRNGTLSRAVFDVGRSDWSVSLIGTAEAGGQYATLNLTFNSLSPELRLDSFRFNGTDDPHNNGFEVVFGPNQTAGDFHIHAEFSDGNPYTWHLRIGPDDAPVVDQIGGPSTTVDVTAAITSGEVQSVLFEYPEPSAAVLLDNVSLRWP